MYGRKSKQQLSSSEAVGVRLTPFSTACPGEFWILIVMRRVFDRNLICSYILLLVVLFVYLISAFFISVDNAPDEYMRNQISFWIAKNGKLPIGNESELINPIWGFSYAYMPYFPSILSAAFIKFFSVFTGKKVILIFASRLVSVFSGVGTVYVCLLIGNQVFNKKYFKFLFASFVGFLPQFVFLCSYLNNDSFSIFCCCLILLSWLKGIKSKWDFNSCLLMGIGIGLLAITYYFAYSWILCSLLVFYCSGCRQLCKKDILLRTIFISFIVASLAGWYFIRNYIIYDGDFLGMNASRKTAELFASQNFKPSERVTNRRLGLSFFSILLNKSWLITSFKSYIAVYGYMCFYTSKLVYAVYIFILIYGLVMFFLRIFNSKLNSFSIYLNVALFFCIMTPFVLSAYYSWSNDYQPQGRYFISSLPALMLWVCYGFDYLFVKGKTKSGNIFYILLVLLWFSMGVYCYKTLAFDKCWRKQVIIKQSSLNSMFPSFLVISNNADCHVDEETSSTVRGWAYHDDNIYDIYLQSGDSLTKTDINDRPDVKNAFLLKHDKVGFSVTMERVPEHYSILLVDNVNKRIYVNEVK